MSPNGHKQLRPQEFQCLVGRCSDVALARILKECVSFLERGEPLPRRYRDRIAADLRDEVQDLLALVPMQLNDGGDTVWAFWEPNRLLAHVVESCLELAKAYGRAANEHMPTRENPWDLLICYDEFVPGDKLKSYA